MATQRIEYIDLMKGVCIILVVLVHSGITFPINYNFVNDMLQTLRMPLYFFLSGLFFKSYGNFLTFFIKKTNNLIIPYLFFSTFFIFPQSIVYGVHSYKSVLLLYMEPYYVPLWFLRCLFFMNIVYYLFSKWINNLLYRILLCLAISLIVCLVNPLIKEGCSGNIVCYWLFYQLNTLTSLFALPFMAIADFFNNKQILKLQLIPFYKILVILLTFLGWYFLATSSVDLVFSNYGNHPIRYFLASVSAIIFIAIMCGVLKKLPYVSYMGRFSIIVLGTHMIPLMVLKHYTEFSVNFCAFITLLISPAFIYLMKKFFPYFTAQKQCIYVENRRIKFFKKD